MSKSTSSTETTSDTASTDGAETATEETATTTTDEAETATEVEGDEATTEGGELPDWAREKLTKANGEAANYRTQLRTAQDEIKDLVVKATSLEELQGSITELQAKNAALEIEVVRTSIAAKHNLPDALAKLLQGDTDEALEAHAKELAAFAPKPKRDPKDVGDLKGGLDPTDEPTGLDPIVMARQARRRR